MARSQFKTLSFDITEIKDIERMINYAKKKAKGLQVNFKYQHNRGLEITVRGSRDRILLLEHDLRDEFQNPTQKQSKKSSKKSSKEIIMIDESDEEIDESDIVVEETDEDEDEDDDEDDEDDEDQDVNDEDQEVAYDEENKEK